MSGDDPEVLAGKHPPGLAEPVRDLVEDQERAMLVAGGAHLLPEAGWRQVRHGADRLCDHCRDVLLLLEHVADEAGAAHAAELELRRAIPLGVAVRAAIAGEWCDVLAAGEQGPDRTRAKERLAADSCAAEAGAVKAVPERDGLVAPGHGAGQLERHVDRRRAARCQQHLREIAGRDLGELRGQRNCRLVGEAARRERQLVQLRGQRGNQSRMAVTEVMDAVAVKIHIAVASEVLEPDAFGPSHGRKAG